MKPSNLGNYFDDFEVGCLIRHRLSKTITESDNNLFSLLTMNHHPIHTNADYAQKQQHGEVLVVGTLVFSLSVGITVPDVSGRAIANLGYSDVKHINPVFLGDTIYAESIVMEKISSKTKADRGVIKVHTLVKNQNGLDVLDFKRDVLVYKEPK